MFQSTPAIAGGRINKLSAKVAVKDVFQSTPAIAGGRIRSWAVEAGASTGFNPRPPLLAGESACPPGVRRVL